MSKSPKPIDGIWRVSYDSLIDPKHVSFFDLNFVEKLARIISLFSMAMWLFLFIFVLLLTMGLLEEAFILLGGRRFGNFLMVNFYMYETF